MIYLVHNTQGNFASAKGAKDANMRDDLVLSEIGKRIAVKPEEVIGYLNKAGVKVSDSASTSKLVSVVSDAIPKNSKLVILFAEDIEGKAGKSEGAILIADSISKFFKSPGAKSKLMKYTKAIKGIAFSADGEYSGGSTFKWVLGIGVLAGLGYVVYKYKG